MKKRKPPIVLGTFLVILLVVVGIIYAPRGTMTEEEQAKQAQQQAEQQQDPNAERPTLTPQESSQIMSNVMKSPDKSGPPKNPGEPEHSSIQAIKQDAYKPRPSDSSTATQWYTTETPKK